VPKLKPVPAEYIPPLDCERKARALRSSDREAAWQALKACVQRSQRIQLRPMVAAWAEDLRVRADAPTLLAQVVARRGGNVRADVRIIRDAKVPMFTLADCVAQPALYEGHYVLIRGSLHEVRTLGNAVAARVFEHRLQAEEWDVPVTPIQRRYAATRYSGNALRPGEVVQDDSSDAAVVKRYDNIAVDTGHDAVLRLLSPDPFLESDRELLILARFDGVRPGSGGDEEEPELVPVLTLMDYAVPDALVTD
jgi:hypothetical protein